MGGRKANTQMIGALSDQRITTALTVEQLIGLLQYIAQETANRSAFHYFPHPESPTAFTVATKTVTPEPVTVLSYGFEASPHGTLVTPEIAWASVPHPGTHPSTLALLNAVTDEVRRADPGAQLPQPVAAPEMQQAPGASPHPAGVPPVPPPPAATVAAPPAPPAPPVPPAPPQASPAPSAPPVPVPAALAAPAPAPAAASGAQAPAAPQSPFAAPATAATLGDAAAHDDEPEAATDDDLDRTIVAPRRAPAPRWELTVGTAQPVALHPRTLIGRRPSVPNGAAPAELITLADPERMLSKTHALLEVDGESLWLTDLGSTNGTEVLEGETPVECPAHERVLIASGTAVNFGGVEAEVSLLPRP